jgi:hypothetical protein
VHHVTQALLTSACDSSMRPKFLYFGHFSEKKSRLDSKKF